jgi:hypothetical protein
MGVAEPEVDETDAALPDEEEPDPDEPDVDEPDEDVLTGVEVEVEACLVV